MILQNTGLVAPGLFVLGSAGVPSYLLDAPSPVLFDAGLACLGGRYVAEAQAHLDGRAPTRLLLTHVHFDHCGAAAQIQRAFPGLTIAAAAKAAEIVARPNALALMARLNQAARAGVAAWDPDLAGPETFEPFAVDQVLADGDRLDLGGGLVVEVLACPGHTWDFLSFWVPERGLLIAGEAAGCADATGYIMTEFLVSFDAYRRSLERLMELPAKVLCQGHRVVYTGEDAPRFLERSLRAALDYRAWVERLLDEENGDEARVQARVKAAEYDPKPQPKQAEPAYLLNLRARVAHLAGLRRQRLDGAVRPPADSAAGID
ncbi:MAG: MBL fold metallo-hydrolase [Thermodesulfobacteriota bacterium]